MKLEEIMKLDKQYFMNTYGDRIPLAAERGKGVYLWDNEGNRYLDFVGGIAVNILGHSHPAVNSALSQQVADLLHCSSLYYIESQARLAEMLCENSVGDQVFFTNSGAEANEAAIKLVRKNFTKHGNQERRYEIITMENSFHGRTLGTLAATGQDKFSRGFTPLPAGFKTVPFNDLEAVEAAITNKTCAIMVEPIQGESGVHPAEEEYLKGLRALCDSRGLLLIFDEIQTGLGRTGDLFAYQTYDTEPDILTLAKGLGNGVPIGAVLARSKYSSFEPGDHGSTFGGNPLACTAGLATLETLISENIPAHSRRMGAVFKDMLKKLSIAEVRGKGLMIGIELREPSARKISQACQKKGLLINPIGDKTLRFLPPLIVEKEHLTEAVEILDSIL